MGCCGNPLVRTTFDCRYCGTVTLTHSFLAHSTDLQLADPLRSNQWNQVVSETNSLFRRGLCSLPKVKKRCSIFGRNCILMQLTTCSMTETFSLTQKDKNFTFRKSSNGTHWTLEGHKPRCSSFVLSYELSLVFGMDNAKTKRGYVGEGQESTRDGFKPRVHARVFSV